MSLTVIWAAAIALGSTSLAAIAVLVAAHALRARTRRLDEEAQRRMAALWLDALGGGHGSLPQPRLAPRDALALLDMACHLSAILDGDAKEVLWRALAARRLGPALAAYAGDPSVARRLFAARALFAVAGPRQRAALQRLLSDSDPAVAAQAAAALNESGADPCLTAMLERLREAELGTADMQSDVLRLQYSRPL